MKRVAIVTSGYLPVPATKGGAVEALDEYLIQENEKQGKMDLTIYSSYDQDAEEISNKFQHTTVKFIPTPFFIQAVDKGIYFLAKNVLKKKKHLSYRFIAQRLWFQEKVAKDLAENDFDKVVLENNATLYRVIAKQGNKECYQGKYYLHLHNLVTNDFGYSELIQSTEKVLGVSNYINGTLQEKFPSMKNEQFTVLRNVVNREVFNGRISEDKKQELRKKFGISENETVILFAGRMDEEKGIRELLQSYKNANIENSRLLIIGGYFFDSDMLSDYEQELRDLAKDLGEKVIFTGFLPHAELGEIYAFADFTVLPSIWEDPAPLTVIEALSSGSPLITTDSGGIPEYAKSEGAIIIERKGDWLNRLSEEMKELSHQPEKLELMRKANLDLTKDWSIAGFYSQFVNLIGASNE